MPENVSDNLSTGRRTIPPYRFLECPQKIWRMELCCSGSHAWDVDLVSIVDYRQACILGHRGTGRLASSQNGAGYHAGDRRFPASRDGLGV